MLANAGRRKENGNAPMSFLEARRDGQRRRRRRRRKKISSLFVDYFPVFVDDPFLQERAPFFEDLIRASGLRARFGPQAVDERGKGRPEQVEAEGDKGLKKGRRERRREEQSSRLRTRRAIKNLFFTCCPHFISPARRPLRGRCSGVAWRPAAIGAPGPPRRRTRQQEMASDKVFFV